MEQSEKPSVTPVDWKSEENALFLNDRMPDELQSHYTKIFREATYRNGIKSHVAVLTSGTSAADARGYKMVFISKEAFLVSAQSITKHLMVTQKDRWAQCLPRYHVGGLAIEARSHVSQCSVDRFNQTWDAQDFCHFIHDNNCTWSSLVPTQIFDLVKLNLSNPLPKSFRVLVGGARMSPNLLKQAQDLKWNLLPSYGMTEAASTIALIENETLKPFPHVSIDVVDGKLAVRTKSLFSFYVQVIKGQIELVKPNLKMSHFVTEDLATKMRQGIMLLGRAQDVVKISGELVSIPKLRDVWFKLSDIAQAQSHFIFSVPDPRLDNKIVLVVQREALVGDKVKAGKYHLNATAKDIYDNFQKEVMPFEKIRNVYAVDSLPRTDLGKIQEKALGDLISKGQVYEISELKLE
jgi:O-succinylbenzoic acid--CoA ligase